MSTRAAPAAADRWLAHALPDGRVPSRVELTMTGLIKVGAWLPFRATQTIDVHGFTWTARAGRLPLTIAGSDRYADGAGAQDWRLWGAVPLIRADGPGVTRSAAWRWVAEALTWLPGRWEAVTWLPGAGEDAVALAVDARGERVRLDLRVDPDGRLRSIGGPRWGNPLGNPYGYYPFAVDLLAETTVDGITVPSRFTAGWGRGTDWAGRGEFFRAELTGIRYRR